MNLKAFLLDHQTVIQVHILLLWGNRRKKLEREIPIFYYIERSRQSNHSLSHKEKVSFTFCSRKYLIGLLLFRHSLVDASILFNLCPMKKHYHNNQQHF